eukprot:TRINITY_DN13351_c0_g1_i1.p1 TRINITY_DN13351_c0_g1~~TRINITY_DN13351_c0_g1_i1.p1  ORF type:complete len:227 (-),score=43.82 TRINITY_DN13351_c0_g1_i1:43-723(-)
MSKVCAVVGVGPGIGSAVAHKFAKEGYTLALISRTGDKLETVKKSIESKGGKAIAVPFDATDPNSAAEGFKKIKESIGSPEVVVYNAGGFYRGSILQTSTEEFEKMWKIHCLGVVNSVHQVLPDMLANKKGTILVTGATSSLRGSSMFSAFGSAKAAARSVVQSLARENQSQGIHVAHIIIDGLVGPGSPDKIDPEHIAETYWHIHTQHPTAWTHELELRPHTEKW